jgi:hypothetical protein
VAEWTHNLCEHCWFDGPGYDGTRFLKPAGQVKESDDVCCSCGCPTFTGIYIRQEESELLCKGDHDHPERWSWLAIGSPTRPAEPTQ